MQKKIPFGTINITSKSKKLIGKLLDSGRVSSGACVREFEKKFAAITGTREAIAVSSGADADALALAVLYDFGARRGDEVIVPALSFVATGNAVLQAGFIPVFADIEKETLNIDPGKIENAVSKRTRAIMPVHLMGKPAKMDPINFLARKYGLYVVEDAAEAHGAEYKGRKIGTLGDMAAYSLYIAHIITTIEGGIVTTNNPEFASVLRSLRCHGRACKCPECLISSGKGRCGKRFAGGRDIRFIFERIGFSAKMNEIEAAVGLGSLECYREIIRRRRKNLKEMISRLKEFDEFLFTIKEEPCEKIGPHAFPIVVREGAPFGRDQLTDYFSKNGIDTRDLFTSMPTQCPGFSFLGYRLGRFPNAEFIGKNGLHIGVHQDLKPDDIDYIFAKLRAFIARKS
jgi:dTDP-4-amino-4,6-dideoxygalactose transaminase